MIIKKLLAMVVMVCTICACQSTPQDPTSEPAQANSVNISQQDIGLNYVWGGEILEITNLKSTTEITILGYPLDKHEQPSYNKTSTGRFIAVYSGFLEPIDYRKGRLVSVSGELTEIRNGNVASAAYEFPVLTINELNLHKRKPKGLPFSIGIGIGIHN